MLLNSLLLLDLFFVWLTNHGIFFICNHTLRRCCIESVVYEIVPGPSKFCKSKLSISRTSSDLAWQAKDNIDNLSTFFWRYFSFKDIRISSHKASSTCSELMTSFFWLDARIWCASSSMLTANLNRYNVASADKTVWRIFFALYNIAVSLKIAWFIINSSYLINGKLTWLHIRF